MKNLILTTVFILIMITVFAQRGNISGVIKDKATGETLIGANVLIGPGVGAVTDFDGVFNIEADYGTYELTVSFVGMETLKQSVVLDKSNVVANFSLGSTTLSEVEVVADVAVDRETPVAFATILPAKLEEELASQDLPMVLNSTPGVYATQTGGGDGDARITIRGFNQRNVAVMIDGIPVNDMENGWVYWSNWFGLDAVTRSVQVQRGLGASKIAIPSVGGTMNILTQGMKNKKSTSIKQEIGSYGFERTTLGLNSGKLENGWGWTLAGSYKRGNGFIDQTFSKGWFYYAKVQKIVGKHIFTASAMGAPQSHGQRAYKKPITVYDKAQAQELYENPAYADSVYLNDMGYQYNEHWGNMSQYNIASNGDTVYTQSKVVNERVNYYHKPQFSLRDFWTVNEKLYISNILYASIGRGGGTSTGGSIPIVSDQDAEDYGQLNYSATYSANAYGGNNQYSSHEKFASAILKSSINNHNWYGFLSTINYALNNQTKLSGGIDGRFYKGEHYRVVYDLLGGDIYYDFNDNNARSGIKRVGDKIDYYNDGLVKWGGVFAQVEHKTGLISTFFNVSTAVTGYKRIDYFAKKELALGDTIIKDAVGYETGGISNVYYTEDSVAYYATSPEAQYDQTPWKYIPGFTVKGGLNYNVSEWQNAFMNIGFITKAPRFNNVIDYGNSFYRDIENERVKALELGYSFRYKKWAANVNAYATKWENKPISGGLSVQIEDESFQANVNGINALHKGVEVDGVYKFNRKFDIEGVVSLGDWQWTSGDTIRVFDDQGNLLKKQYFNAAGVHVGDAAQTQLAVSMKYKPFKGMYVKYRLTSFSRNYSNFNPFDLNGQPENLDEAGNPREPWILPNYMMLDLHTGYSFKIKQKNFSLRVSILNALDAKYIADAANNDSRTPGKNQYNAESASVFFGLGRRFNTSLKISL